MQRFCKISILTTALFVALCLSLFSDTVAYAETEEVDSFNCNNVVEIPTIECQALVKLYNSTEGPQWIQKSGWLANNTPCNWYGVHCRDGHVTVLSLKRVVNSHIQGNGLNGFIPKELGNLSKLAVLSLYQNKLSGPIPSELGNLSQLTYLDLSGNRELSGSIPAVLGDLSNLTGLRLGGNQLIGSIPKKLGGLSKLTELDLGGNQLSGSIPKELGKLLDLTQLDLAGNKLSGPMPAEMGNLSKVTIMYLYNNQLSGSLPSTFGNLSSLTQLHLGHNQLSGAIPSTMGDLSNLIILNLYYNQLEGSIPATFGNLSSLRYLGLYNNKLSGVIPSTLGNLPELTDLHIHNNHLSGSVPPSLSRMPKLDSLYLAYNQLSGFIPDQFKDLDLSGFHFNDTQLCLPDTLIEWFEAIEYRKGTESCVPQRFIYVSSSTSGQVGTLNFRDEDILVFDTNTERWSIYFDGSRVGLSRADVNAFHILDDGNILLSLNRPMTLDLVRYDDSDIILFTVENIGSRTAGTFSIYFDGSDVQLTSSHEDIDAIGFSPDGDLIISTLGTAKVRFNAKDEDLMRFEASSLGEDTSGVWHPYFHGSHIGLTTSHEDISAVWIDSEKTEVHLSALRRYDVESIGTLSGDEDDIFICEPISLGYKSECSFNLFWDGDDHGYDGERIDGYAIGPAPSLLFLTAASHNGIDGDPNVNDEDNEPDLTEHEEDDVLDEEDVKVRVYLPVVNR